MDHVLAQWKKFWMQPNPPTPPQPALSALPDLPEISLSDLDEAIKLYSPSSGTGVDCINPRVFGLLPDDMRRALIELLRLWESTCVLPAEWPTLVVFIPKATGGERPIGLVTSLLRLWGKLRRAQADAWESSHNSSFCWGVAGKLCDRAVWEQIIFAAHAASLGQSSATMLLDLEKFYEHVAHDVLLCEAEAVGFPPRLARAAVALYGGLRAISYKNGVSATFKASRSIIAGCSLATTMARVLLFRLLTRVMEAHPSCRTRNVVDDVSLQCSGPATMVARELAAATRVLIAGFRSLHLVPSPTKTVFVASHDLLAEDLELALVGEGIKRSASARLL